MLKIEGLLGIVVLALWIYCLVEVIGTPESRVRNLPKIAWVIIVLIFPLVGSIAWLAAGRPAAPPAPEPRTATFPEYDRPGRLRAGSPDDDEAFLREVRERAEEQRRRYRASRDATTGDPEPTPEEPTPEEPPGDGSPEEPSP